MISGWRVNWWKPKGRAVWCHCGKVNLNLLYKSRTQKFVLFILSLLNFLFSFCKGFWIPWMVVILFFSYLYWFYVAELRSRVCLLSHMSGTLIWGGMEQSNMLDLVLVSKGWFFLPPVLKILEMWFPSHDILAEQIYDFCCFTILWLKSSSIVANGFFYF